MCNFTSILRLPSHTQILKGYLHVNLASKYAVPSLTTHPECYFVVKSSQKGRDALQFAHHVALSHQNIYVGGLDTTILHVNSCCVAEFEAMVDPPTLFKR